MISAQGGIVRTSDAITSNVVSHRSGEPSLHRAAFDRLLLGIRPDCTVEVRPSILAETDRPMLRHGLHGVHNQRIWTSRSAELKPDPELFVWRFERSRRAG